VALGAALGLFLGKPVGVLLFAVLAVRLGLAALPAGVGWLEVLAAGAIAGIGFSVSLFITELAFTDPVAAEQAKTGVLAATALALVAGGVLLRIARARTVEA
jgi:NhaA family Na+:H+ antiporter